MGYFSDVKVGSLFRNASNYTKFQGVICKYAKFRNYVNVQYYVKDRNYNVLSKLIFAKSDIHVHALSLWPF